MRKIISFLVMVIILVAGINASGDEVCYDGVCFPDGDVSFADSVISYETGSGAGSPNTTPSAALGPPDYDSGSFDGEVASLGQDGFLVVKFDDNSLTTSGSTDDDLWIFEVGTVVESTFIEISKDGVNWIEVGKTSGATSGVDIDAYIGSGVVEGERYSYVRITDDGTNNYNPTDGDGGPDIDAVGAIESAAPVTTTTIDPTTTTTLSDTTTTTTTTPADTTTTTTPADTTTTTTKNDCKVYEVVCGDYCCTIGSESCCGYECCRVVKDCCFGYCCGWPYFCTESGECVYSVFYELCLLPIIYGEGSEEVELLRDFRDEVLSQSPVGQELIKLYYQWSPAIVKAMEEDEEFKDEIREFMDEILLLLVEVVE